MTRPAPRATRAATTRPTGLSIMARLRIACAIACRFVHSVASAVETTYAFCAITAVPITIASAATCERYLLRKPTVAPTADEMPVTTLLKRPPIPVPFSICTKNWLAAPVTDETTGSNFSPRVVLRFSHEARRRACLPAAVSASRANAPCASADCFVMSDSDACALALSLRVPLPLVKPSRSASAFSADSFREMPYFSIGSISPRMADARASTASCVDPPNCADRSAPMPMRSWVCLPKSLMPLFFKPAPRVVASSLYSFFVRPSACAACFDDRSICGAKSLKTARTPPTDCSRSLAPFVASRNRPTTLSVPIPASRPAPKPFIADDMPDLKRPPARSPAPAASLSTPENRRLRKPLASAPLARPALIFLPDERPVFSASPATRLSSFATSLRTPAALATICT